MNYKGFGLGTARGTHEPSVSGAVLGLALVWTAAMALGGCRGDEAGHAAAIPEGDPPRPNVVLVLADTLRADHLGAYGYARDTSPQFDELAAESFLFESARAQAPCTFPSANSILTGQYPHRFVGQPDGALGIPEAIPSLAEILSAAGYDTAAISASPIVRATPGVMNPGGGFAKGFDRFSESCEWLDGSCVHRRAMRFLDQLEEPFFLYLHYLDPHDPYAPPDDWPRQFAGDGEGLADWLRIGDPNPMAEALYKRSDPSLATPEALAHLTDLYDDEIAYWDSLLGRLVGNLEHRGVLDETILVVLSDHGESFYEHGALRHCRSVWDSEIKTPLLVRLPPALAAGPPRRIASQAANLDVVPTLLDYLEIPAEPFDLPGRSLRPAIAGGSGDRPPVFSAWHGLRAVHDGRFKLIAHERSGRLWLFDVEHDPGETEDLSPTDPREVGRLKGHLRVWLAQTRAERPAGGEEAAMERLRNLGYVQ